MTLVEIFLIGIGLSMDAFAVSICKGLSYEKMNWRKALIPGVYFGVFQALMPICGFFLGESFRKTIEKYDHWVTFILLVFIGINMIRESREEATTDPNLNFRAMFPLAIATSIDALAVGVTFSMVGVNIMVASILIGCTTLLISTAGFKIGNEFGSKYKAKAEILGGIILIFIGVKILLEHIGILSL